MEYDDESCLQFITKDYLNVLGKEREALSDNMEYMRLAELKFIIKK